MDSDLSDSEYDLLEDFQPQDNNSQAAQVEDTLKTTNNIKPNMEAAATTTTEEAIKVDDASVTEEDWTQVVHPTLRNAPHELDDHIKELQARQAETAINAIAMSAAYTSMRQNHQALDSSHSSLKMRVKELKQGVKADVEELRAEIEKVKAENGRLRKEVAGLKEEVEKAGGLVVLSVVLGLLVPAVEFFLR